MNKLTRLEKCELALRIGYTYDKETGEIKDSCGFNVGGIDTTTGYIRIGISSFNKMQAHHFAWYYVYGNVDFTMLDHINQIKTDNRIDNLRISNGSLNQLNKSSSKGYIFIKKKNRYRMEIVLDGVRTQKYFKTAEEARELYLQLKKEHIENHYRTN